MLANLTTGRPKSKVAFVPLFCYVQAMEKVLAVAFSFIVFVIGLAFLITGRLAVGLLLLAVSLFLAFLAFRRKEAVVVEQRIEIGGDIRSQLLKCRNCGAELDKGALEVRLGAVFIACPYCRSQYQLEEEPKW
jgi:DNA-directed RNA polymerase subunit RPC12/RpoP